MTSILLTAVLLAAGVKFADKCRQIRKDYIRIGIYFGILSMFAVAGHIHATDINMMTNLQSVPAILAVFFFGPREGLLAGCIACAGQFITSVTGFIHIPVGTASATLLVALYAAAMRQWVFDKGRPGVIPAAISAFFGEIIHLSFIFIVGVFLNQEPLILEYLAAAYPIIPIAAGISAGLAAIFCGLWKKRKKNCMNSLIIGLLFTGLSFFLLEKVIIRSANRQTKSAILAAVRKLTVQFEDQIDYSMHGDADIIIKELKEPKNANKKLLQHYARLLDIDEINVFMANGRLQASNRQAVIDNHRNIRKPDVLKEFDSLTTGKRNFISQDFRQSYSEPELYMKYIGIPFPRKDAFLQLGFSYERMIREFSAYFFPMFSKSYIENSGFFVVTDQSGKIVAPIAGHKGSIGKFFSQIGITGKEWNIPVQHFSEVKLFGVYGQCYRCMDLGQWHIYAFLPYAVFYSDAITQICLYTFILLTICIVFRLVMIRIARVQKKIDDMQAADMELAGTIQNSELPEEYFDNDRCRIRASMTPAKEVGGDFYDHYVLADGRIVLTIADVSGKGIPAAIFMMKAKNILKNLIRNDSCLAKSVSEVNAVLNKNNDAAMFVTAWIGIFNPADGSLRYVSAGHNPPLILRRGMPDWLNTGFRQKPLAAFDSVIYKEEYVRLASGDSLFLYTDGVTEAVNPNMELFGCERLKEALRTSGGNWIDDVTVSLKNFTASAPAADDITMLTLEVKK